MHKWQGKLGPGLTPKEALFAFCSQAAKYTGIPGWPHTAALAPELTLSNSRTPEETQSLRK